MSRPLSISRAIRLHRPLAVLLSAVLLLQSAIAGAFAAHEAAHGRVASMGAADHATTDAHHHDVRDPASAERDSGMPDFLHELLHSSHFGCGQGLSVPPASLRVSAAVMTTEPAPFAAIAITSFRPDPSLRPPIAA